MRRAGLGVRIASIDSASSARAAIANAGPRLVVVDSIAFGGIAPIVKTIDARVVALVHMRVGGAAARTVIGRAEHTVAVSTSLVPSLRALGARRISFIAPGCDGVPRAPRRATTGNALRVLCVANWSPAKGIDTLLAATARIPDLRVTFAGDRDGPYA